MTIKTLTYIHNLLIENEKDCDKALQIVRKARNQAEDENAENLGSLQELYTKTLKSHTEALAALQDFEEKEWN